MIVKIQLPRHYWITPPVFLDYLDKESISHFARLKQILDDAEIRYQVNPRLVRGLDYYCKTVFEWTTDDLGAQGTVCGGGRYDGLIAQLGGRPTPGIGWAMGVETLDTVTEIYASSASRHF